MDTLLLADQFGTFAIHVQRGGGGAARRADADELNSVPAKVQAPGIFAGIEDGNILSRIRISHQSSRRFSKRTRNTREGEILKTGFAAGDYRNDVIDVERRFLCDLGKAAIFASVFRPLNHPAPQMRGNRHFRISCVPVFETLAASRKGDQPSQRDLRLPCVPPTSGIVPGPVYRAEPATVFPRLSATETWQVRPELQWSVEWLAT